MKLSTSPKKRKFSFGQGATAALLLFVLGGNIFYLGYNTYEKEVVVENKDAIERVSTIKNILETNYLHSDKLEEGQMIDGALKGMTESLGDPYTYYITSREYEDMQTSITGMFGGIGISVKESTAEGIQIGDVKSNFSGALAGLEENDIIIAVDGKEIKDMPVTEAVGLIRGTAGTKVVLTIKREGIKDPITVPVIREVIELDNLESKMLVNNIGYISFQRFSEGVSTEFVEAYGDLKQKGAEKFVLDLRNNGGGLVTEAVSILSYFFEEETELVHVKSKNFSYPILAEDSHLNIKEDFVVLTNNGSASASEILVSALKDHKRAEIIGTNTFGKGLIQKTIPVDNESGLVVTVSEYITIKDEKIHGLGIKPTIEEKATPEDLLKGIDSQLEKSIDYLSQNK